ncbi:protein FATTY ACID EXPORT 1, chloroplastic-like isoform X4 [Lycium barbarum]|uniref:protein FATTY ACID EXPORT 1, chloroplastic-like isoform X4 n=1 Tax=Lycium barbarum TaxID=112863 RepID=UPI00293F6487|nr:protein FATTY ACID EXPORT 1, chloroplastic-like isoform X4 [Lycium barbarum]XP_060184247.1 protein FATTY ACID EXPORT 1, chloroplastic-like isoform X4 [Lycium barbarum]XP_060184248.1 protein FATTY ACID EXPORT 1, chloroplastic-like isoform X4 [Lycium barbarum]XP_060184249.1 protein FATTY ACID EXPORT 1, chloroplastic-like isoform X4 [Lycium barbarum]
MSSAISQLSCFSSINHRLLFHTHLHPFWVCGVSDTLSGMYIHLHIFICHGVQVVVVRNDGRGTDFSNLENKTTLGYTGDASQSHNGSLSNSNLKSEELVPGKEMNGSVQENSISHSKKTARIHDFCFGIPFGGLVFTGGIVGFIFSRNPATLSNGVLFGGALLAFSAISLRVWRQGKSSLPFIIGQSDKKSVSHWLLCCHQCCNVLLLLLRGIVWGESTTQEAEGICCWGILMRI